MLMPPRKHSELLSGLRAVAFGWGTSASQCLRALSAPAGRPWHGGYGACGQLSVTWTELSRQYESRDLLRGKYARTHVDVARMGFSRAPIESRTSFGQAFLPTSSESSLNPSTDFDVDNQQAVLFFAEIRESVVSEAIKSCML